MGSSYKYKPLESASSIRLIKLLPELIDDCLACKISHFDTMEKIEASEYYALSYCWGDPKPTRVIFVNGCSHPLHENLWQFFNRMWQDGKYDCYYWTDSLCINQSNRDEVNEQVCRMDIIYYQAKQVIVWLGHDQRGENAMKLIHGSLSHPVLGDSSKDSISEAALYLLLRPYWVRVWIIQEVVLAKKAFVTYGRISMDLDTFEYRLKGFQNASPEFNWRPTVWSLCNLRKTGGKQPLWKLLTDFNLCESTKEKDRIYGLLGLVADKSPQDRTVDLITVDIFKNVEDVFWDAMLECDAPWSEYGHLLLHVPQTLGRGIDDWNFRSLADYATKNATSDRHSQSAQMALRVFEALNVVIEVTKAYPKWQKAVESILSVKEYAQGFTNLQNAAIMGLALAVRSEHVHRLWKGQRNWEKELGVSTPSSWRCDSYEMEEKTDQVLVLDMQLEHRAAQITFMEHELIRACGNTSCSHRENSSLIFKIPEINLCLGILSETTDNRMKATSVE